MLRNFGSMLTQKRIKAQLSISELAKLSGLPEARLEALEKGWGDYPNFDTCYLLGQVISRHSGEFFVVQDLWEALRTDKLHMNPRTGIHFAS
jgi:DNA-binding XRE family transcriptional regulator